LTAVCQPLVNAPMLGVITTRIPPALFPKVMTAIVTLATIAGPLGVLVAGALLEHEGLIYLDLGGTPEADGRARSAMWPRLLAFLSRL
jgi:predicted permease